MAGYFVQYELFIDVSLSSKQAIVGSGALRSKRQGSPKPGESARNEFAKIKREEGLVFVMYNNDPSFLKAILSKP